MGFYRGLWIPLMTISFVRESPLLAATSVRTAMNVDHQVLLVLQFTHGQRNIAQNTTTSVDLTS